jgi:hypothetical protein
VLLKQIWAERGKFDRVNDRVFTNLTPFIPLSFKGEGEEIYREGFHPSLTYTPPSLAKGRGSLGDRLLNNLRVIDIFVFFNVILEVRNYLRRLDNAN